jgi:hypothetical protein
MIGADAHSTAEFFAELNEWSEVLTDAGEFLGILFITVLADFEFF